MTNLLSRLLRKAILPTLMLSGVYVTATADDALVLNFHDGTKAYYRLSSTPEVTFTDSHLCVQAGTDNDKHEFDKVDTFTFGDYVSVDEIVGEGAHILCPDKSTVLFVGFPSETAVSVTDASGRVWYSSVIGAEGTASVSIADMPAGVYIISTSTGHTLKIVKA